MTETIHIVMAVYQPDPGFLQAQLNSIAAQTHRQIRLWCVAADCESGDLISKAVQTAGFGTDPARAWDLIRPAHPLDPVRAFETGLQHALDAAADGDLFALSDQDDVWAPHKLETCRAVLRERRADLVHSDATIMDEAGQERHRSMFRLERRVRHAGLRGLLYLNNVTGMTTLFSAKVVRTALPFPAQSGVHFYHDLWLALVAEIYADIPMIPEPLVAYRQHGRNAVGAIEARVATPRIFSRPWMRDKLARYALAHFLAKSLYVRAEEIVGGGVYEVPRSRLAPLRVFLKPGAVGLGFWADSIPLALRGHLKQAQLAFGHGLVGVGRLFWALRHAARVDLPARMDALLRRGYEASPGHAPPSQPGQAATSGQTPGLGAPAEPPDKPAASDWQSKVDIRTTLRFQPQIDAFDPAVIVLVPTLNPSEIFAGIVTALDVGLGLAAQGIPVRFIATDLPIASPQASQGFLNQRLQRTCADMGVARNRAAPVTLWCGVSGAPDQAISMHEKDVFLATAWWSAHLADTLLRAHGFRNTRFYYLIQDFEPNFYPWGSEFAEAMASYDFDFEPVFNTTLLRDYFHRQGFGFAGPDALAFRPSIDVTAYSALKRPPRRGPRRLAVYGRPSVARNMFPIAVGALARFLETRGLTREDIELVSIGMAHEDVRMPGGLILRAAGKIPLEDYPTYLAQTDVGLALMYSPHPSHLPIEMAAAGVQVVTNGFVGKDLSRLSPLIRSETPTAPALARALEAAWDAPEPQAGQRALDLSPLGMEINAMTRQLAARIKADWADGAGQDYRRAGQ